MSCARTAEAAAVAADAGRGGRRRASRRRRRSSSRPRRADPLADRPLAEAVLVEERLQAVEDDEQQARCARRLGGRRDDVGSGGHGAILPRHRDANALREGRARRAALPDAGGLRQEAVGARPVGRHRTRCASNEPLGPRVTRTRRATCVPFEQVASSSERRSVLVALELDLDAAVFPRSASASGAWPRARARDEDVPVLRRGTRRQVGRAHRRRGNVQWPSSMVRSSRSHVMRPSCPPAGPGHNGPWWSTQRSSVP